MLILWLMTFFRFVGVWLIADLKKVKHEWVKDRNELKILFLNGVLSAMTPLFFILALQEISLSDVYFLAYTAPAWVLLMAVFFLGEKLNQKKVFGLSLTLLGVYFIANPTGMQEITLGMIYALVGAVTYAGGIVTGRELKDYSYHTVAVYSNAFQVVLLGLFALFVFPVPAFEGSLLLLALIAFIGLFRGIAADLYFYALEKLEASSAAVISLSELVFASVLAYFIFGETHTLLELAGYAIILLSGMVILLRKSDLESFEYLLHMRRKH